MLDPLPGCNSPIFWDKTQGSGADYTLFYAPGCVVVAVPEAAGELARALSHHAGSLPWAESLRRSAQHAVQVSERQRSDPFRPECLTLYLHNQCNLGCVYCYADPAPQRGEHLDPDAIAAAAEVVAASCGVKGLPLTVALHGGGEPALFQEEVERTLALVNEAARRHKLGQFRYIATNGVMSEEKARWLVDHFDLIGLSCDGPPELQDQQRSRAGGGTTSEALERTADVLHQAVRAFHVRATITAATNHRQAEIAEYLSARLGPAEIHFEPVYLGGRMVSGSEPDQAEAFVSHFLAARNVARQYGVPLTCSGTRPGALHGPYCNVFRHVLNLIPPGVATACFKTTDARESEQAGMMIGAAQHRRFEIDHARITTLRQRLSTLPERCTGCFNRYHCARGCPDSCDGVGMEFRCALNQRLAEALLREQAEALWSAACVEGKMVHGSREL